MVIVGDDVARRPQPIAVQRRANLAAIREGDRGRTIPWLHQRGIVLIEGAPFRIHQRVLRPCFRDQHHHGMRKRVAARDQDLQRIVDAGGIRLPGAWDQWPHLVQVRPDELRGHRTPARMHPVHIAANRVDLAVVREEAIGMRQPPRGERVGREALVDQRQSRLGQRIVQVLVEGPHLWREQQALIDHRARRERWHVKLAQPRKVPLPFNSTQVVQRLLADGQDFALERILILHFRACHDDRLADHRHRFDDALAETGQVYRDLPPSQQRLALSGNIVLE